jgi:hypothetical protein
MSQLALFSDVIGSLNNVGWTLPERIQQEQWRDAGSFFVRIDSSNQWWKGDWWNAGAVWGEGEAVCAELGLNYGTIHNCGSVAKAFEFSRRRENLTFGHHAEVMAIKDKQVQDRFLDWCEEPMIDGEKPRSTRALREQIKVYLEEEDWPTDQRERKGLVRAGAAVLANLKTDDRLVQWAQFNNLLARIDRSSKWGNPFEVGKDGDRDYVIDSYQLYLERKISLHESILELDGKVLACWCFPEPCHGGVLLDWISKQTKVEAG